MGNILTQKRNGGAASATALDELTYNYHTTTDGLVSNRLYQVNDVVSAGNYTDDIDDQGTFNNTHSTIEAANNYGYDELGNLVRDAQEEIASIEWTVYGKMKKITRNSGSSKADLEFGYDASGNRLWKKVTPKGSGAVISTYYYLRDAQGNEMCRYVKYTNTTSQLMFVAQEHSIYGSSRVGVDNRKDTLYLGAVYSPSWGGANTSRRALGLKSFELANHLGNVLVTVSDKPVYKVSSTTIYFNPEITSSSDYYPFGAPIAGRGYSSEAYRFGYNTQEKTDEIAGAGNHTTAMFWEYDTRLGRRWNVDPVVKPWESLYACLSDNPILLNDPLGDIFKIGTQDQKAKEDISKQVKPINQKYLQFCEDGEVKVDFSGLKQSKIDKAFMKDKGLQLINDLSTARDQKGKDLSFYYGTEGVTGIGLENPNESRPNYYSNVSSLDNKKLVKDEYGGYDVRAFVLNASKQPYSDETYKPEDGGQWGLKPLDGFDGKTFVGRGTIKAFDLRWDEESKEIVDGLPKYKDKLTLVTVTRSEVVYHELNENLLRTKYGYSYKKAHSKAGGTGESSRFFPEEN